MNQTVSRREMLRALAAGVALATGVAPRSVHAFARSGAASVNESELDAWVSARLADADVKAIASAWRQTHPSESSAAALTRAIVAGRRRREQPTPAPG